MERYTMLSPGLGGLGAQTYWIQGNYSNVQFRRNSITMGTIGVTQAFRHMTKEDREGRGVEDHMVHFGLRPEDLRNKTTLNVGAGCAVRFEVETILALSATSHLPMGSTVFYSLSPDFVDDEHRQRVLNTTKRWAYEVSQRIHLMAGYAQALPLPDEVFDVVILMHVLEHTPEDDLLYRELFRVLKPGGRLYLGPTCHGIVQVKEFGENFDTSSFRADMSRVRTIEDAFEAAFTMTFETRVWEKAAYPDNCREPVSYVYGYYQKAA